jgi:hypothetical protein
MKKRLVSMALAGAAVLGLSGASVFAMAQVSGPGAASGSNGYGAMQAMHNSPAMQQAMAQFAPQLRAQCNAMQAQMSSYMSSQMNGAPGSGTMGGQMMGGR